MTIRGGHHELLFDPEAAGVDPYGANVVALLHLNGANGSTAFPDVMGHAFGIDSQTPVISTAQSKFGGASLNITAGVSDRVKGTSVDFAIPQVFTVEFWLRFQVMPASLRDWVTIGRTSTAPLLFLQLYVGSTGLLNLTFNGTGTSFSTSTLAINTWYHIAITRDGFNIIRTFVNGVVSVQTVSNPGLVLLDPTSYIALGGVSNSPPESWIDEFRYTVGVCRYTTTFTPPAVPFPDPVGAANADPHFSNVKVLMHADGSNGATSTTDVIGHTVTRQGGAITLSTAQQKFGSASTLVPAGSTHYWDVAVGTDIDFGTGDFTIEAWAYLPSASIGSQAGYTILCLVENSLPVFLLQIRNALTVRAYLYDNAAGFIASMDSVATTTTDAWHHYAITRNGTAIRLFLDGVVVATATSSATFYVDTSQSLRVGMAHTGTVAMNGYIDDVRITKGVARYTGDMAPPAAPFPDSGAPVLATDPNFSSVKALIHFDGSDGATTVADVKAHNVLLNGGTVLRTAAAKFGSAGAEFTSGGATWITNNGDFNFGTGDFTIEGWFYQPTATVGFGSFCSLFSLTDNAAPDIWIYFPDFGSTRYLTSDIRNASNVNIGNITGSTPFPANTWVHVALTRESGVFRLFMAGVLQGTDSSSATAIRATASNTLRVGYRTSGGSAFPWRGYYDEFRVTAMCLYTANFTPPVAAFPDSPTVDPHFANVVALLHFDGANAGTTFTDQKGHTFTATVGSPTTSTSLFKFGTASQLYGTGSQVACAAHADFTYPQEYTVEFWLRTPNKTGYNGGVFDWSRSGFQLTILNDPSGDLLVILSGAVTITIPSASWPINTWHHFAITRNASNVVTVWVNGVSGGTASNATTSSGTGTIQIGRSGFVANAILGNIDDLRITSGVCRYNATFTPPVAAFPDL